MRKNKRLIDAEYNIRSLSKYPTNPYYHSAFGDILADQGYLDEALVYYHKALESPEEKENSLLSEIHNNIGWVYTNENQGNPSKRTLLKAKDEFAKAIAYDDFNVKAHHNLRVAMKKLSELSPYTSSKQNFIAFFIGILLFVPLIFFLGGKLSEPFFVTMFLLLVGGFVLVLLYHDIRDIKRLAFGPKGLELEFERNIREPVLLESQRNIQDVIYSR